MAAELPPIDVRIFVVGEEDLRAVMAQCFAMQRDVERAQAAHASWPARCRRAWHALRGKA